ncbi:T9SS type A sorting domain-containing protein [Aurantibacillus circumpalustris]|uniref:T9SS type A sorting domain-containing protein n=1 Tax=Aurantibacillus circumpalustris TaxID=3036359 RepID=UPI00295C0B41|nr:T9SS type A sorting domain-containing protein [Aurantibacillus circumpalustris]
MKNRLHIFFYLLLFVINNIKSQITNIDFEASPVGSYTNSNAVNGWTVSSITGNGSCNYVNWQPGSGTFSVLATPILNLPYIGNLLNSPLGGSKIVALNNASPNYVVTKIAQNFAVNYTSSIFQYAYAGSWDYSPTETCCTGANFQVIVKDCFGTVLPCFSYTLNPNGGTCPSASGSTTLTTIGNIPTNWANWVVRTVDLSPFIGSCVTVEVIANSCALASHVGRAYFDARCASPSQLIVGSGLSNVTPFPTPVGFCQGSNQAQITAPLGYSNYQWYAPGTGSIPPPQGTSSVLTVSNPVAGSVYTVNMLAPSGCIYTATYAIGYASISVAAIGASPSCSLGSSGSASVVANGSGTGYNYTWYNSTSTLTSNSNVVSNLSIGVYSVLVKAAGSQSSTCGQAVGTVTVNTSPQGVTNLFKPFCTDAYLNPPAGTGYQWYNNLTPITSSLGGTQASYTVTSPNNGSIYRTTFTSVQGCKDSIEYTLISSSPGVMSVSQNSDICVGATNGSATITISPAGGFATSINSYSITSLGITPNYSASLAPTSLLSFTANGLSSGTYSVNAFDGNCKYSDTFSISTYSFNFNLSPSSSTICNGSSGLITTNLTTPPSSGQYSFSWTPTSFLSNTQTASSLITPTVAPGNVSTIIYSVAVVEPIHNCSITKTTAVTVANLLTPTINLIPILCKNSSDYTISTNPQGGTFTSLSNTNVISNAGVISPSNSNLGVTTFTYSNDIGTCHAHTTGTFLVNNNPVIAISGNSVLCQGEPTTLLANGADTYVWSNSSTNPFITVSPPASVQYIVTGTNILDNCSGSKTITVLIIPQPTITISGTSSICLGATATLTANGANTYNWNNGSTNQSIFVTPTITTNYSVTGTTALANCTSTQSMQIQVKACTLTVLNELFSSVNISIYPNPSNGKFVVESLASCQIVVTDLSGKIIFEKNYDDGKNEIDLSEFANGIYILKKISNGETTITKLIKKD